VASQRPTKRQQWLTASTFAAAITAGIASPLSGWDEAPTPFQLSTLLLTATSTALLTWRANQVVAPRRLKKAVQLANRPSLRMQVRLDSCEI
jgi:hypothetical protein